MSLLDRYHAIVHEISEAFGYHYHEGSPDWIHPFIHLILVLAPMMLAVVGSNLLIRLFFKRWRRRKVDKPQQEWIRGLDASLFSSVFRQTRKQQALMIIYNGNGA